MPRSVAIVFDDDFSDSLERVSFHTPVWMADTPANREAAERVWQTAIEWPHLSVTLFRPVEWSTLLQQIAMHLRFDMVEAIGAPLTPAAQSALSESGFTRVEKTPTGFRARR